MAEHGAHLSSTRIVNPARPNVFEVLAQDNLAAIIRPAFKHLIKVLAEKYPPQLGPIFRFYDEIFLFLDTLLQHHYLKNWNSSFAENFYGLKRVSTDDGSQKASSLSKSARICSLACIVLVPYLKTKLDFLFEDLQFRYPDTKWKSVFQPSLTILHRVSVVYLCIYPYVRSSWECVSLLYQMSYMLQNGRFHSPAMHLSGAELVRSMNETKEETQQPFKEHEDTLASRMSRLLKLSASTAASCVSYSMSVGVFFLQFLDWWHATHSHGPSLTALPTPPPPMSTPVSNEYVVTGHCPLCGKQLVNSTALTVSGFVFCYPCIHQYVRDNKSCPVTGYPTNLEHLVKIFHQDL